ncbi:MAG: phosphoglycerate dehydrogenase [Armatimonadetes bacterium]|nr:phosphoglycerate dehydrogenase [Armatimonadota bacterium]
MEGTVLVTAAVFVERGGEAKARLEAAGLTLKPAAGPLSEETLIEQLQGCVAVIASMDPYTERVFAACPDLKVIARWGIGYDSVDVAAATRHGVMLINTPGTVTEAVADMTFALMLGVARRLPYCDAAVRSGEWPTVYSGQVFGKTLGLVGFGQIGQAVARRAAGFSMRVLATDPCADTAVARAMGVELATLEQVLRESDFVSLHATLCAETRRMIGAEQLSWMKPSAYLINAGRGGLVDQEALTEALRNGSIAGAGLDVLDPEPPAPGEPILELPNVVFTPHCSSFTHDTVALVNNRVADNLLEALSGHRPRFLVNAEVWEARS